MRIQLSGFLELKCSPRVGKEVAGDPQHLDSSLALQLESQVRYFIQIPVGLLQGGALRSHIPVENTRDIKHLDT